jgi:flagellar biosynthesis/type III secretory pathway M-ring protein FliF/YscJ
MALYNRPNLYSFIVAQSMPLEKQQELVGLFWTLALAVILLFLFVAVMMVMARVVRRRMRLNEADRSGSRPRVDVDPWGEAAKRIEADNTPLDWDDTEPDASDDDSVDWDAEDDGQDKPRRQ